MRVASVNAPQGYRARGVLWAWLRDELQGARLVLAGDFQLAQGGALLGAHKFPSQGRSGQLWQELITTLALHEIVPISYPRVGSDIEENFSRRRRCIHTCFFISRQFLWFYSP